MRILCISKYAAVPGYGTYLRHFSLCREWRKLGHEVILISSNSHITPDIPDFKGAFMEEVKDGVRIVWLKMPKYTKANSIKRIFSWFLFEYKIIRHYKRLALNNPDIVYCSSLSLLSVFSGLFFKRKYKSKFVFEVRDIWPLSLVDLTSVSKYNPLVLFLAIIEKMAYRKADLVVGTMPGLHLHIAKIIKKPVKCICIPQGFDKDFYKNPGKLSDEFISKYFPKDKFTVTFAGALSISFALDKVILTAQKLEKECPDIHFLFLGEGGMKQQLEIQAAGLKNVTFVPKVPKEYVFDFLRRSTVLLHSFQMKSVFEYGISPNKFIDYMYSARPIIVMFSGYPSLINEANCGEFIPSEDTYALYNKIIEYNQKSEKELDEMGKRGKDFLMHNLSYDKLATRFLEEIIKA